MKSKKAQEGIIVTVLLILIAIAAVAAVAYFVVSNIKGGTTTATDKTDCQAVALSLSLDKVTNATNSSGFITNSMVLSRQSDDIALRAINVYVNGKLNTTLTGTSIPNKLETTTASATGLPLGATVRINGVLNSTGYICESGSEQKVISA